MTKNRNILVQDIQISVSSVGDEDYISLTDMVKGFDGGDQLIYNWMRNRNTLEFLGIWEQINNPNFKGFEFETFKAQAGLNNFSLTPRKWIDATNAIGLISKAGRNGGTFAHKDVAFEFGSWLSPTFKLYLIKEFQRLKELESQKQSVEWQVKRELARVNYRIHTDAIQQNLLSSVPAHRQGFVYATEADMLNAIVFGQTAKQWKTEHPNIKDGNQRDHGRAIDNAIIANLESYNALLISQGYSMQKRISILTDAAQKFRASMEKSTAMQKLEEQASSPLLSQNNQDQK